MGDQVSVLDGGSASSIWVGRVVPGAPLSVVEATLQAAYQNPTWPTTSRSRSLLPIVTPGLWAPVYSQERPNQLYRILLSAGALLLAVACANASAVLFGKLAWRRTDTATRMALGAPATRILSTLMVEAIILAGCAGVCGLATARLFLRVMGNRKVLSRFPEFSAVGLDLTVFVMCLICAGATILLSGLLPALSLVQRAGLVSRLSDRSGPRAWKLPHVLLVLQIAATVALTAGALVLNRSAQELLSTNVGVDVRDVIELRVQPQEAGFSAEQSSRLVRQLVAALKERRLGAVTFADVPLSARGDLVDVWLEGDKQPRPLRPSVSEVSDGNFDVMRVPVVSGRVFQTSEFGQVLGREVPVVLSTTLARSLFGESSVGRTFDFQRVMNFPAGAGRLVGRVVGVVGDTLSTEIRGGPVAALYLPTKAGDQGTILLRTSVPFSRVFPDVRATVASVDPDLPITFVRPLEDEIAQRLGSERVLASFSAVVAMCAILLTIAGVGAGTRSEVHARTRDFGTMIALGATGVRLAWSVLSRILLRCAIGSGLGLIAYGILSTALSSVLYGVSRADAMSLGASVLISVASSLVAGLGPALRAGRTDPAELFRTA